MNQADGSVAVLEVDQQTMSTFLQAYVSILRGSLVFTSEREKTPPLSYMSHWLISGACKLLAVQKVVLVRSGGRRWCVAKSLSAFGNNWH